jgi:phasin family protein
MSDKVDHKDKIGASAEKAYAAAADAAVAAVTPEAAPAPVAAKAPEKVAAKAPEKGAEKAGDKPMALPALKPGKRTAVAAAPAPAKVAPKAAAPVAKPAPAAIKPAKPAPIIRKRAAKAPAIKLPTPALAVKAGPASTGPDRASIAGKDKPSAAATSTPAKAAVPQARAALNTPGITKESIMDMTNTFTDGFKTVVSDAQDKAKAAYAKSTEAFGDYAEFAKGNVEAIVESGKILASGLQGLGTDLVADTKQNVETLTADVKQLAAAKSPSELVKLQGDLVRRNFDSAVAYNTKAGEAMLKLVNEVFVPISGRLSVAMDKLGKAA